MTSFPFRPQQSKLVNHEIDLGEVWAVFLPEAVQEGTPLVSRSHNQCGCIGMHHIPLLP